MRQFLVLIATFFKVGHLPLMPGTWASLITTVLVYFIKPYWQAPLYIQIASIGIVFVLGIPAASVSEKYFNKKDPRYCVIDEVAGQMVSLLLIPHSISFYIAGFLLFRVFDILKPFPVRNTEKIPGGFGIMLDDIAAGLYALGVLHLYLYLF